MVAAVVVVIINSSFPRFCFSLTFSDFGGFLSLESLRLAAGAFVYFFIYVFADGSSRRDATLWQRSLSDVVSTRCVVNVGFSACYSTVDDGLKEALVVHLVRVQNRPK